MKLLDIIRDGVRQIMRRVAGLLNSLSDGRLSPNMVTITGLLAHIPIAGLIAKGYWTSAGVWLIVFGLFDTLDGELARLQKRASAAGMFLDSLTDRMKEILIYMGIGSYITNNFYELKCTSDIDSCFYGGFYIPANYLLVLIIAVLGSSLLTSYINAWGEAIMSRGGVTKAEMNKVFRGGLASFEIRMTLLVLGLLTGFLSVVLIVIGVLVVLTIIGRMYKVFRELKNVQS